MKLATNPGNMNRRRPMDILTAALNIISGRALFSLSFRPTKSDTSPEASRNTAISFTTEAKAVSGFTTITIPIIRAAKALSGPVNLLL